MAAPEQASLVAGVDRCRAGWVVALVPRSPTVAPATVFVVASFADVLVLDAATVAVDIPIGLPDRAPRPCDVAARARLGPRRSSIFPAPARAVLAATDYDDALARSRAALGVGLSKQSWNLVRQIRDVDDSITPSLQSAVVECGPELCFASMAGAPLALSKHTRTGLDARVRLLRAFVANADALAATPPRGARADDVVDALACAWTARRVATGQAVRIGDGSVDARDLRMEIAV